MICLLIYGCFKYLLSIDKNTGKYRSHVFTVLIHSYSFCSDLHELDLFLKCFSPIKTIYLEIRNFLDQSSGIVSTTLYKPAVKSRSSEMTNSFFMVSPLCK